MSDSVGLYYHRSAIEVICMLQEVQSLPEVDIEPATALHTRWIRFRLPIDRPRWEWGALGGITFLAIFLDFWQIDRIGFANTYYATAVKSMSLNWHNFFFLSFDPGGFVSIDKPPLGFWLQTLCAKIFGFTGFSLILPQALAGGVSVLLLYALVRRYAGGPAGLIAALALAIYPINVVTNRSNIVDGLLVMTSLAAALALAIAMERGSFRLVLLAGVLIGVGFNIKMLQAYLIIPPLAAAYFFTAPIAWWKRTLHLAAAGAVALALSLSWLLAVDLTPPDLRPYVGSSQTNSEMELAFGYNGLQRYTGQPITPKPTPKPTSKPTEKPALSAPSQLALIIGADQRIPHAGSPAIQLPIQLATSPPPEHTIEDPGLFRLFQPNMGGQIAWLLPLAIISLIISAVFQPWRQIFRSWRGRHLSPQQGMLLLWGVWLVTQVIFFSYAGFLNPYYVVMLSPAICALAGMGLVWLYGYYRDYRAGDWKAALLPLALMVTALEHISILNDFPEWDAWLPKAVDLLGAVVVLALAAGLVLRPLVRRFLSSTTGKAIASGGLMLAIGMTLSFAPAFWTQASFRTADAGGHPLSGPERVGDALVKPPKTDSHLLAYLLAHDTARTYLAGTLTADKATPIIFDTGRPVMAMGGFGGGDPILTAQTLADLVTSNQVRFFYLPSNNLTVEQLKDNYPDQKGAKLYYNNSLTKWIAQHCLAIPSNYWSGTPTKAKQINNNQLFDCIALQQPA